MKALLWSAGLLLLASQIPDALGTNWRDVAYVLGIGETTEQRASREFFDAQLAMITLIAHRNYQ